MVGVTKAVEWCVSFGEKLAYNPVIGTASKGVWHA